MPEGHALSRLRTRLRASPRWRVLRALATGSPWLMAGALVFLLAEGLLPNLALIALGAAVGAIPGAVRSGLGSSEGHTLLLRLTIGGLLYGLSLLRGPAEDALGAAVQAKMAAIQQRRLIEAVSAPPGIAHLEDPEVLDRLASAQGELTAYQPSGAAMTLIGKLGDQLAGLLSCLVLASFRWWLGLGMLIMWLLVRRPLRDLVRSRIGTFRQATEPLRRSWYYLGLAWRPAPAKEIRIFGLGPWMIDNYRTRNIEAMRPSWDEVRRLNRRIALVGLGVLTGYAVATATLGWAAYHHTIALGTLVVMLTMLPSTMQVGGITAADFQLEIMLSAVPDLDALTESLRPTTEAPNPEVPKTEAPKIEAPTSEGPSAEGLSTNDPGTEDQRAERPLPRKAIRFEQVTFRYPGGDHDVLDGLDLTLEAGKSTAVVGVNGAGKTTLITLLAGLREPTSGRILVDGTPGHRHRHRTAAVFQDFTRFPLTARENVALNLRGEPVDETLLTDVAARAGATDLIANLPHGWDTILSSQYDKGQDLSGGQWQRIALARALYAVERGAGVLVMDEPTAQLDVRAEARFYDRFLEITRGVTSVVISHRFSTVRKADRIAVLDQGRITELGTHDELLASGGTYADMFSLQASRFGKATRP